MTTVSIVEKFRLTKLLHDQVEVSGDQVDRVLRTWNEKDYKSLCDYVTQCKGVIPKYVMLLARLTGTSTGNVVMDIVGAQAPANRHDGEDASYTPEGIGYLPEDIVERSALLQSIIGGRESSVSV